MTHRHARLIAVTIATVSFGTPITAQQEPTPQEVADIRVRAEQGDADAQFNLGQMLAVDFGLDRSDRRSGRRQEALLWLSRAAESGHAQAYREFLFLHARGLGGRSGDYSATLALATRYKNGEISFVDLQEQILARALPPHSGGDVHCTYVPPPPPPPPPPGSPPDPVDYSHWNLRMNLDWAGTWCEVAMVWTKFNLLTREEYTKLHCVAHPMHCTPVEDARP